LSAPPYLNAPVEAAGALARLDGKVALVTGGESGIGQDCAIAMARAGAAVIVTGRSERGGSISARGAGLLKGRAAEEGSETVRRIVEAGGRGEYMKLDVTVEDDWKRAIAAIERSHRRLDILVNNAGNVAGGALDATDIKDVWYVVHLNIEGAFLGMTHAWPLLKASRGVIFNMNSTGGIHGAAGNFAYPASKGGMLGITRAAAADGKPFGIRAISLHPGSTWTPGMARARGIDEAGFLERTRQSIPLKRPAYPADIATAVVYFSSEAARSVSSIQFNIDGGTVAR
jgi:NAD(P)-dependent dehydrogenase (short-subunit alcohol dehydrogenase family)